MEGEARRISDLPPTLPPAAKWDAFISYSHAADCEVAPAVQRALQRLAKPIFLPRALMVFLDTADLAANPGLWPSVRDSLDRSRYLVVLASPEAAASEWVDREIEHWVTMRGHGQLLLAVTGGHVEWDDDRRCFDPDRTTALPPSLMRAVETEPTWVDLRGARESELQRRLDHAEFRSAILSLAAPIHGKPKAQLDSDAVREHKRLIRWRRAAITTLVLLLAAACTVGVIARAEYHRANDEARESLSRALAAEASNVVEENPALGLVLAAEAAALTDLTSTDDYTALLTAHGRYANRPLHQIGPVGNGHKGTISDVAVGLDETRYYSSGVDGTLTTWDAGSGAPIAQQDTDLATINDIEVNPVSGLIATGCEDGRLIVWRPLPDGSFEQVRDIGDGSSRVKAVHFSHDGDLIYAGLASGWVRWWSVDDGEEVGGFKAFKNVVTSFDLDPTGRYLAVDSTYNNGLRIWDIDAADWSTPPLEQWFPGLTTFSPNGGLMASVGATDGSVNDIRASVTLWDVASGEPKHTLDAVFDGLAGSLWFAEDGAVLVVGDLEGHQRIIDVETGGFVGIPFRAQIGSAHLVDEGRKLVSADASDAGIRRWRVDLDAWMRDYLGGKNFQGRMSPSDSGLLVAQVTDGLMFASSRAVDLDSGQAVDLGIDDTGWADADLSSDGQALATITYDQRLQVWDLDDDLDAAQLRFEIEMPESGLAVRFDPLGERVATAGHRSAMVRLWDAATGEELGDGLGDRIALQLAFNGDGSLVAAGNIDGDVMVWATSTGERRWWLKGALSLPTVAFGSASDRLAVGDGSGRIFVWLPTTEGEIEFAGTWTGHQSGVSSLAWRPGSDLLVSGDWGGVVRFWDGVKGVQIGDGIEAHPDQVMMVRPYPERGSIVTAGRDGSVIEWPVVLDLQTACRLAAGLVDAEQLRRFLPADRSPQACDALP